jgi:thiopeptide-type bacteriocin biosynthesis protein
MKAIDGHYAGDIDPERWTHCGFFVLRTPLLPWQDFQTLAVDTENLDAVDARTLIRERLKAIVSRPAVAEALYVASSSLSASIPFWLEHPDSPRGIRVQQALVRYLARMTGRPTPFGLFAGCSLGEIGASSHLTLPDAASYRRRVRLDNGYLDAVIGALQDDPALRDGLAYFPNGTLYRRGEWIRYTETVHSKAGIAHHLMAAEASPDLLEVLRAADKGARVGDIARALLALDPELDEDDALEYVHALVRSHILLPELQLGITGQEPAHRLLDDLKEQPCAEPTRGVLRSVQEALEGLDQQPLGRGREVCDASIRQLEALPVPLRGQWLFHVDLIKPTPRLGLSAEVAAEMMRGAEILRSLAWLGVDPAMDAFKASFRERYGEREMPLLEVLDEESGIGFERMDEASRAQTPLLTGVDLQRSIPAEPMKMPLNHRYILSRIMAGAGRVRELRLKDEDLAAMPKSAQPPAPDSIALLGTVAAPSAADVDRGAFRVHLKLLSGPSGANLLGRFCHGDPLMTEKVRQMLRVEESFAPDAVFAEIVHLPQGRVANVLIRPLLRDHEISLLGRPGVPDDRQIPLGDLHLSVRGDQVVMRSRRLDRVVIPRLSSAHGFRGMKNHSIYRFLGALQSQGTTGLCFWHWGPFGCLPFLPRLSHGRTIFSLARWRLDSSEIVPLLSSDSRKARDALQELRERTGLPRFVGLEDPGGEDHILPVDLDNPLSVEAFLAGVRNAPYVILLEGWPRDDELAVEGAEGRFCSEVVVPVIRRAPPAAARPAPPLRKASRAATSTSDVVRQFPPGGEWLFAKIYAGPAVGDRLLADVIRPLVGELAAQRDISRWFFLRYNDPEWHLRLRFAGDASTLNHRVLPRLNQSIAPCLANGSVHRFQIDTYHREVERYGGPAGIELAESFFHLDSQAVIELVGAYCGSAAAQARTRFTILSTDRLLSLFQPGVEDKLRVVTLWRDAMAPEFVLDTAVQSQLGRKYRQYRGRMERLLSGEGPGPELAEGVAILDNRDRQLRPVIQDLRRARDREQLEGDFDRICWSLVHLHVNRMSMAEPRDQEFVVYDLLARFYRSLLARSGVGSAGTRTTPDLVGA